MNLSAEENRFLKDHLDCDFEVFRLAGDASTRKYHRVICNDSTWALMSWEPFEDVENYPFLNVLNHFKDCGVLVPQVHSIDGKGGLVLLEDLGDLTLERKFWENQDQSLALPFYKKAVEQLVKIHTKASVKKTPAPVCQKIEFDFDKFLWELNYAKTHLLEGLCGLSLSESTSKSLNLIFSRLAETLASEPQVVCHRDFHSRNVMLKLGRTYIIDFQDARRGPRQYDLVSLLYDSYVDLNHEMQSLLLDYYISQLPEDTRKECESDHFSHILSLQVIQRCFKACGSFASFYQTRGDTRYLKYLLPTLRKVESEISFHPEYKILSDLFSNEGLTSRNYEELCEP